ncbi:NAD(P)/FAD-dependent oxidoreductase [Carnobacterium funditum]|uniref:NAD(P)/FAD-dependent oxidoreductase n=1 Tax=Carnobacterium funditum TaxID=2752 RepID=UPI000B29D888|nr:FAD-binding oxidoreductase [Carnobacterium funditum]
MIGKKSSINIFPKSIWREFKETPSFDSLQKSVETEVGIIGGGIVGIISAYLLAKAGKKVILIEAEKLIDGVTGFTTAKITAQHGLIYDELIKSIGQEKAKLYYDANLVGLNLIKQLAVDLNIDCDLSEENSFVFAQTKEGAQKILAESEAYKKLAIDGGLAKKEVDLPFVVEEALVMYNQVQFHPVKFLTGLVEEIKKLGGQVYENTRALKVIDQEELVIVTENMSLISCDKVIIASHYPINDNEGIYFTRLSVNRSYAIAARTKKDIPVGLYISADQPTRSLRSVLSKEGEKLILIAGDGHATGRSKSKTIEHYRNLEEFGEAYFDIKETLYHWSSQDLTTLDKVPYIGRKTVESNRLLIATGFNKWGMSNGAVAALILTDQIVEKENEFASLFDPTRSKIKKEPAKSFIKSNASVAKEFISGKIEKTAKAVADLEKDEGGMIEFKGEKNKSLSR